MSELVADFFRHSEYLSQPLLCRSLVYARKGYATVQGNGPKTAAIRGAPGVVGSVVNVLVESNFIAGAIKHPEMDRQTIARGKYGSNVVGHSLCPDGLRPSLDYGQRHSVAFKGQPPLSAVQETDVTTEPNGDSLCSD